MANILIVDDDVIISNFIEAALDKLTETPLKELATWTVPFEIIGLSEQGLSFISTVAFSPNIKIDCEIFQKIDILFPFLHVSSCIVISPNSKSYKVGANFIGL